MRSQYDNLKIHYQQQKKLLDQLRQKHLEIAKKAVITAETNYNTLVEKIKTETVGSTPELEKEISNAALKIKEAQLNFEEIQKVVERQYTNDLAKLMESTQQQIAHPTSLTDEKVKSMDLSNYEKFDKFSPEGHQCMGYYLVNGRHFALWKSEKEGDVLKGTTRVNPLYDETALKTMYGEEYFGDKATLQVGIPDRGPEEVQRRKNISELQVSEWKQAGIEVQGKRVVEIGGGSGYLSEEVKNQGGKPLNVELCKERCESCEQRGIPTYNGFLQSGVANEDDQLQFGSTDIVACYDLLEHIINPHEGFIQAVNAVLKDGGYLCIRVPEGTEPTLHLVDHVNHFSFHSLKQFLEHYGFEYVQRPEPEEGKRKFELEGEGKRYSGTFKEGSFESVKDSDEKEKNVKFRTKLSKTVQEKKRFTVTTQVGNELQKTKTDIIDRRTEKKSAKKPIEERTIENMTVYFRKRSDCDYTPLNKFKVQQNKVKF